MRHISPGKSPSGEQPAGLTWINRTAQAGVIPVSGSGCPIIHRPLALAPGTRLGPYEVTAQIGAGGMGEVYRGQRHEPNATSPSKSCPSPSPADPERLARFQREARSLSPRSTIRTSRRSTASNDRTARRRSCMELVEGPTLADRIAQGPIPHRRSAAHRQADRRGARSGARARHHPSRPQAREHQAAA